MYAYCGACVAAYQISAVFEPTIYSMEIFRRKLVAPCGPVGPWLAGCDRLGEACIRLSMHRARAACVRLNMRQAQHSSGSACIGPVQHTSGSACVRLSMRQAQDASVLRPVQYASGHFSVHQACIVPCCRSICMICLISNNRF